MSQTTPKKRIAIVGAGASGLSAAHALAQHKDRFNVVVFDSSPVPGGLAISAPVVQAPHTSFKSINEEDSSALFHNTYRVFSELGFSKSEYSMQLRFEESAERDYWGYIFPEEKIREHKSDIKRFGWALKVIRFLEPLFAIISIRSVLRLFRISKNFGQSMLYPLITAFFGTGHQTPHLSSMLVERLFMDPSMQYFVYSPETFLESPPSLRAFPHLDHLYAAWTKRLIDTGVVKMRTLHAVTHVERTPSKAGGIRLWYREVVSGEEKIAERDSFQEEVETFDELILATDADSALRILGADANWLERKVLGNVRRMWDITSVYPKNRYFDQYCVGTVPWMMWMNGRNHTYFAGAWSLLNSHDIAVVSGMAAAYRLGASFPYGDDPRCKKLFAMYLGMCHGIRMKQEN